MGRWQAWSCSGRWRGEARKGGRKVFASREGLGAMRARCWRGWRCSRRWQGEGWRTYQGGRGLEKGAV